MVHRYYIKCTVCHATSLLRIQLPSSSGTDDIFFNCRSCGVLNISDFTSKIINEKVELRLDQDHFEILQNVPDQVSNYITIAVDLPFRADANDSNPQHFSTFLDIVQTIGLSKIPEIQKSLEIFSNVSGEILGKERLLRYFYDKNDLHKYMQTVVGVSILRGSDPQSNIPDASLMMYKKAIHPLDKDNMIENIHKEILSLIRDASRAASGNFDFVKLPLYLEDSLRINKKSIELINKVMASQRIVKIAYLIDHLNANTNLYNMHVSIDRFQDLKSMYMESFENFHKALEYLIIMSNISNSLPPLLMEGKTQKWKDLRKAPSARKNKDAQSKLTGYPYLSKLLTLGDNQLRNSIGHYEITIEYSENKVRLSEGKFIPYSQLFKEYYYALFINIATLEISRYIININREKELVL